MFGQLEIFQLAQGMARHAETRQAVLAANVANADTPGYRARDVASFAETYRDSRGGFAPRATRAGHVMQSPTAIAAPEARIVADAESSPNGNSVSLEAEMAKAAETKAEHDLALGIYRSALGILRSSLGR